MIEYYLYGQNIWIRGERKPPWTSNVFPLRARKKDMRAFVSVFSQIDKMRDRHAERYDGVGRACPYGAGQPEA